MPASMPCPVCQLKLRVDQFTTAQQHELAQELDCLKRRAIEIQANAAKFSTPKNGHLSASENENGALEYAVVEGRIIDPETLRPILFASDLAHSHTLHCSLSMAGQCGESIDVCAGAQA